MIKQITNHTSRLGDVYLFIEGLLEHGLHVDNILKITDRLLNGLDRIFDDNKIFPEGLDSDKKEYLKKELFKKNFNKVSNYKKWILNYGLLMLCSIFEEFLTDLLNEILEINPNLCLWNGRKDIVSDFKNKSLNEKYKVYINKLNISENEFFNLNIFKPAIQEKYKDFKFEDLEKIFKKRHKVAHSDDYIMKSVKELEEAKDIFEKLILNLSFRASKKWNIKTEYNLIKK